MRNTITKTVSMTLVAVMVLGIAVMPMRAEAALADLTPKDVWSTVIAVTWQIAKVMIQSTTTSEVEAAAAQFAAYFEPSLTESFLYVTAEQMNQLSTQLAQNGIGVYPTGVPGRELIALALQDNTVQTATGTVTLDADVGDYYTYSGKTVVRVGVDGAAGEDFDSYTGITSTDTTVGITPEGGLVDIPVTGKGSGATVSGATINFNSNNWQVKNENGTYVDIADFYYNPITQTYDITTIDNRHYTYQFYYDYTYITYIGSSAEYREAYKVYYELPDGRSSGDLTADELKGLSLQFDMVNYDKAASDTLTQALFPFDGNLDNESYYDSSAQWVAGASTEYLESPDGFGGSLFINANGFNSKLNFNLESPVSVPNGFTIQFRIYLNSLVGPYFFQLFGDAGSLLNGNSSSYSWSPLFNYGYSLMVIQNTSSGAEIFVRSSSFSGSAIRHSYPLNLGEWYDITYCWYPVVDYGSSFSSYPAFTSFSCLYVNGVNIVPDDLRFNAGSIYGSSSFSDSYTGSSSLLSTDANSFGVSSWNGHCPFYTNINAFSVFGRSAGSLQIDNLRIVSTSLFENLQSFTPSPVPFDTNLVYVLPSVADLNDNTVAIMSQLPVSGYRVGGIRPTDPTLASGYVYMHIDGEYIDSVQQWNGAYWEEVTARLYTGIRWIPVTAFNVFTLEDMFDIIDPDADGSGDNVDDIYKYYLWWSGEWGSFQQWLQGTMQTLIEAIQASGGSGGGSDAPVVIVPGYNDQTTTSEITMENPDGSTTKTTIVSNAAGLVYSNSVTTYPTDADGNTKTITVYTDSSGVMYQTETTIDRDGNVTVTEPTKATGTLGSILKMITNGVMSIAGTVIEGFVTIVVDAVKFVIEFADDLISGVGSLLGNLLTALTDFGNSSTENPMLTPQEGSTPLLTAIYDALPSELTATFNLAFIMALVYAVFRFIHF